MADISRMQSVADIPRLQAQEHPDSVALDFKDRVTTFRELDERSSRVAQGLIALGKKAQARVGYLGKNSGRYLEVPLGALKARCVVVGVNWRLAPPEIAYVLNDAGCEILFVSREYYDIVDKIAIDTPALKTVIAIDGGHLQWESYEGWRDAHPAKDPVLPIAPDDDVIQLYTSGTTGITIPRAENCVPAASLRQVTRSKSLTQTDASCRPAKSVKSRSAQPT